MKVLNRLAGLGLVALLVSAAQAQKQYIVVLDSSASRATSITSDAQQFVTDITKTLSRGDELVMLEMLDQGVSGAPVTAKFHVPERSDGSPSRQEAALEAYRRGVALAVPRFFSTAGAKHLQHTDILSTLPIVAELQHDAGSRRSTVVFLSDMLQSANGIEMDKGARMPADSYLAKAERNGTLAHLSGVCIAVVGADTTTRLGNKVKAFWQSYFRAAGAHLDSASYRLTPPPVGTDFCR